VRRRYYECEVKARLSDGLLEDILNKLADRGFKYTGRKRQVDIYLNHPCRDFGATDEALRVRVEGARAVLCYKGPRRPGGPVKERLEVEVGVSDCGRVLAILEALGFREVARVSKVREEYVRGDVRVCLDSIEGLGRFVEVEGPRDRVLELVEELGIGDYVVDKTYLELLMSKDRA